MYSTLILYVESLLFCILWRVHAVRREDILYIETFVYFSGTFQPSFNPYPPFLTLTSLQFKLEYPPKIGGPFQRQPFFSESKL